MLRALAQLGRARGPRARRVVVGDDLVDHPEAHAAAQHALGERPVAGQREQLVGELHVEEAQLRVVEEGLNAELLVGGREHAHLLRRVVAEVRQELAVRRLVAPAAGEVEQRLDVGRAKRVVVAERRDPAPSRATHGLVVRGDPGDMPERLGLARVRTAAVEVVEDQPVVAESRRPSPRSRAAPGLRRSRPRSSGASGPGSTAARARRAGGSCRRSGSRPRRAGRAR